MNESQIPLLRYVDKSETYERVHKANEPHNSHKITSQMVIHEENVDGNYSLSDLWKEIWLIRLLRT